MLLSKLPLVHGYDELFEVVERLLSPSFHVLPPITRRLTFGLPELRNVEGSPQLFEQFCNVLLPLLAEEEWIIILDDYASHSVLPFADLLGEANITSKMIISTTEVPDALSSHVFLITMTQMRPLSLP